MKRFPDNFMWGAATSSHQVEGDNNKNDWWKWERDAKVEEASGKACDHYRLFREDLNLARDLKHNAHRFSLEWSRIEPSEGLFDEEAIAHYGEVIKCIRSFGMEPIVTLNHFTLPLWLYEKGGWAYEKSGYVFQRFTERVAEEFGKDVKYWITINEPGVYMHASYVEGTWPPGSKSLKDASIIFGKLLEAHCLAYRAIHAIYKDKAWPAPMVGIAKHIHLFSPCRRGNILDAISTWLHYHYFNRLFIESLMKGSCKALGMPKVCLPLKRSLDFIGLNYYTRDFIHFVGFSIDKIFGAMCTLAHHVKGIKRNFLQWEIYPEGIYKAIMECRSFGLPIIITENGICTNDDSQRASFIKEHLVWVWRAIRDGAKVMGYIHWSLLDNFEWAHGYGPRFGLIEVDYATQHRKVKPSARAYADIIRDNGVKDES